MKQGSGHKWGIKSCVFGQVIELRKIAQFGHKYCEGFAKRATQPQPIFSESTLPGHSRKFVLRMVLWEIAQQDKIAAMVKCLTLEFLDLSQRIPRKIENAIYRSQMSARGYLSSQM